MDDNGILLENVSSGSTELLAAGTERNSTADLSSVHAPQLPARRKRKGIWFYKLNSRNTYIPVVLRCAGALLE